VSAAVSVAQAAAGIAGRVSPRDGVEPGWLFGQPQYPIDGDPATVTAAPVSKQPYGSFETFV